MNYALLTNVGTYNITGYPASMYGSAYPTFGQDISSRKILVDDIQKERATNGLLKLRSFFDEPVAEFIVVHTLTITQKLQLEAFYTNQRMREFNFVWNMDSSTHLCMFTAVPEFSLIGGTFYTATVNLAEV
mgnify:CR=1 FL=1